MKFEYRSTIKRLFDLLVSITGLLIFWPVMLIIGLLVCTASRFIFTNFEQCLMQPMPKENLSQIT
jgi:lipopolysaccharide/colanic/teichoic acid biosynthesis glycosyltransferase